LRTLVTGASGFLGGAILRQLAGGDDCGQVRVLVRPGRTVSGDSVEIAEGDLSDPRTFGAALEGVDVVIHAGARVSTSGSWEDFAAANVRGTQELIAASEKAGVDHFVHVSSLSVYDIAADGASLDEDSPLESGSQDRGFYSRSKLEADLVAQKAMKRSAPVTIVRPGLLFGPGRPVPLARRSVAAGPFRLILASPGYLMPMAFVDNVADAIVLASRCPQAIGRAYTLIDDHVRQDDYARVFRDASGQSWRPIYIPPVLIRTAVSVVEGAARAVGRTPPMTRHQVDRTLRSARFDGSRARRELDWQPKVPVSEALQRSFEANRSGTGAA